MKAILWTKYGAPDLLKLGEVPTPVPKDNEVLIKVYAVTVNRTDCAMLRAKPFIMRFITGLFKPNNPIMGTDFAGKIEAVGKNVTSLKVGDSVFGFNDKGVSSHAQYLTRAADSDIAIMPANTSFEEATASIEGAHYAYNMLNKVAIKKGQKVLVNGATGAIGSAAVQLLTYYGLDVTTVCNAENSALVKSLGATQVIDYTQEDFTKTNEKYSYIFDTVGKSTFAKCKPLLETNGAYISSELGPNGQNLYLPLITSILGGKKVKFPFPSNIMRSLLLVKKLMEEGKFKAVIDRKYPLEETAEAFRYVESGEKIGTVVINIAE